MKKIKIGILGLGRIGIMHAKNISTMPEYEIIRGVDAYLTETSEKRAHEKGVPICSKDPDDVFLDPEIDAVVIASTTDTHADFIIRAAKAGKDIFCEKPIDHDVEHIIDALKAVKEAGVILQVGFMRRFDSHHNALAKAVHEGKIGNLEVLKITDRDPAPPSMEYIRTSGGIWVDFMIHDFDMARFIMQSEAVEVYATGTSVCDPEITEQGDVGSGHAIVKFENGAIAILETSRRATFGEDQRIEALGSKGMLIDDNVTENNVKFYDAQGYHSSKIHWHFPERYKDAYFVELQAFAKAVNERGDSPVDGNAGLQAVLIAEAALRSAKSGKAEPVEKLKVE